MLSNLHSFTYSPVLHSRIYEIMPLCL